MTSGASMMVTSGGSKRDGEIEPGEDELEDVAFFQRKMEDPHLLIKAGRTLSPNELYLDTCSLFHMCLTRKQMRQVEEVSLKLSGDCNAGTTHSIKRGCLGRLFMFG